MTGRLWRVTSGHDDQKLWQDKGREGMGKMFYSIAHSIGYTIGLIEGMAVAEVSLAQSRAGYPVKCTGCGGLNRPLSNYCSNCGNSLRQEKFCQKCAGGQSDNGRGDEMLLFKGITKSMGTGMQIANQAINKFTGKQFDGSNGDEEENRIACPKCKAMNPKGINFCGECGVDMIVAILEAVEDDEQELTCHCCAEISEGQKFCYKCGENLEPVLCGVCGTESGSSKFCQECGTLL